MTVRAALEIVARSSNGELSASEIVDRVLAQPVYLTGKTPRATVQAQLYTRAKKGELFRHSGRGKFEAVSLLA